MSTDLPDRITVEENRVILRGALATAVLSADLYAETPTEEQFKSLFEIVNGPGGIWLAKESYSQGVNVMSVIKRKDDGRLFGYQYWTAISKHAEAHYEPNGDDHGFEYDDDLEPTTDEDGNEDDLNEVYVWLPIEPFTITGYRFPQAAEVAA
jgi:hypothetical protein